MQLYVSLLIMIFEQNLALGGIASSSSQRFIAGEPTAAHQRILAIRVYLVLGVQVVEFVDISPLGAVAPKAPEHRHPLLALDALIFPSLGCLAQLPREPLNLNHQLRLGRRF